MLLLRGKSWNIFFVRLWFLQTFKFDYFIKTSWKFVKKNNWKVDRLFQIQDYEYFVGVWYKNIKYNGKGNNKEKGKDMDCSCILFGIKI